MANFDVEALMILLVVIVVGAAAFRWLFARARVPAVAGEITFGIALGPSVLGWVSPQASAHLFPAANAAVIEALAWIGLILFVYVAGAEIRWRADAARPIFGAALGGLLLPFFMGAFLATAFPAWFFDGPPHFNSIVLLGVALTVSALPVLARILEDVGHLEDRLGAVALGSATADDIVGWILLALIASTGSIGLTRDIGLNLVVLLALFGVTLLIDRALRPWFQSHPEVSRTRLFVLLLGAIFASALLTHAAGLHAVLGPFAVGAVVSRHPGLRRYANERLGDITRILLLPLFFVLAGTGVDLRLLPMPQYLLPLLIVLVAATVGKLLGAFAGARAMGETARDSLAVGTLLNARGAVALVVAKVGLDAGLLAPHGFALVVVVITITTLAAPLLFRWLGASQATPT
jgi:Kef-type K+ transport system membrane component KefB